MNIKQYVLDNKDKHSSHFSHNKVLKTMLYDYTNWLPSTHPVALRIWHIVNNVSSIPNCGICNKPTTYSKANYNTPEPYNKYCSVKCRAIARKQAADTILTKDFLYEQHIVLKKSLGKISEDTGFSVTPIKKRLLEFGIQHINYTKVNSNVYDLLSNYDFMYDLYWNKNTDMRAIADIVGTSSSTVQIWLHKHDIPVKDSNVYDRKFIKHSKPETEILEYIESIYDGAIVRNGRSVIGAELDIYIPEHNFAIEYNGMPWHTEYFGKKDKSYHLNKTELCLKNNIHLIHIWPQDWESNKDVVKSYIQNKLNLNTRIYARKCVVRHIDSHVAKMFMQKNHLQGGLGKETICMGLYNNNDLVSVMTFSESRFNKNVQWELVRFASKRGYNVVGGASKLLAHFKQQYTGSIVSYADRRYSNGMLYRKLGFELHKTNAPGYKYIKNGIMYNRYTFMKKHLAHKKDFVYDPAKTEKQNVLDNGYDVVWDCGTYTFILD